MKFRSFFGFNVLFFGLLLVIYVAHVNWIKVDVVFYAAIADAVLAACLAFAVLLLPIGRAFNPFEKLQLFVIWLLMGYSFAISVPTVIDRSLSFYILEKIAQRGGGIRQDAMSDVFTKEYMKEHRLVDVRLTEQIESGTVVIENGCVRLTDKGRLLSNLSRSFRMNLLPKRRLLMGEYSDDLTDPFRFGVRAFDYGC
ncbi:hypothetical protein [Uliginosibacterium aquaticum]|uniref:Uncharacterized protein n=1 Tax=Uliginosibacterium aquaticum TaxID=2731212 RepID=A0ABX2IBG2_9RHOO|nr:hypothetical protein [Uliginosibacterium aquaticum]NSL53764.1 hypothetical protein [Uliginosibacterium aquaticum]